MYIYIWLDIPLSINGIEEKRWLKTDRERQVDNNTLVILSPDADPHWGV